MRSKIYAALAAGDEIEQNSFTEETVMQIADDNAIERLSRKATCNKLIEAQWLLICQAETRCEQAEIYGQTGLLTQVSATISIS